MSFYCFLHFHKVESWVVGIRPHILCYSLACTVWLHVCTDTFDLVLLCLPSYVFHCGYWKLLLRVCRFLVHLLMHTSVFCLEISLVLWNTILQLHSTVLRKLLIEIFKCTLYLHLLQIKFFDQMNKLISIKLKTCKGKRDMGPTDESHSVTI